MTQNGLKWILNTTLKNVTFFFFNEGFPKNKNNSDSMIVSDKIERQEHEEIAPLPVIHGEEKVQDYDSEEDICQSPACRAHENFSCQDCEDIIYYLPGGLKRICHSKNPSCIRWTPPSWPGLATKPAWRPAWRLWPPSLPSPFFYPIPHIPFSTPPRVPSSTTWSIPALYGPPRRRRSWWEIFRAILYIILVNLLL